MLDYFTPQIVWGLFPRLLGLVYLVAIGSLFQQVVPLVGARGMRPIALQLRKIRQDYPSPQRYLYFPTLLWLNAEDWFLRALVGVGVVAALLAVCGDPWSPCALAACWLVFLSFDLPMGLTFPWDSVLLEAGFLALFLPPTHVLPVVAATAPPLPALAWAFRWLLFRLMFGFGKFKFTGTHRKEALYLKGFLIGQPIPNRLGWYAHFLPHSLLKAGLVFLFLVEIPAPFLIFIPGDARLVAALAIAALMVGIQLTSNFGFFNILVLALCVTLLDRSATIFQQSLNGVLWPWGHLVTHTVVLIVAVGGLVCLPFNSWCAQAWLYWPSIVQVRNVWMKGLLGFYRALAPFRIVHAYGVFPPISGPAVRWIPVVEGTRDGKVWEEYRYRFIPSEPCSAPTFVAPHHPRLDHAIFYEPFGNNESNFIKSTFSTGNPYTFSHASGLQCIVQRLLEGDSPVTRLFRENPFPDAPPLAIRVTCYMLEPTSPAERARTGLWWRRTCVGPHLPPASLDNAFSERLLPDPELFHWDDIVWKRRARLFRALPDPAGAPDDARRHTSAALEDLDARAVEAFWADFVAHVRRLDCEDWRNLPRVVAEIRRRYSREQLQAYEQICARLSLLLSARIEPHYIGKRSPKIEVDTYFHLGLLCYHIVGEGRDAYEAVMGEPAAAAALATTAAVERGFFILSIFWYDTLVFQARKLRLGQQFVSLDYQRGLPGFLALLPFVLQHFQAEEGEQVPAFARDRDSGEWLVVDVDQE